MADEAVAVTPPKADGAADIMSQVQLDAAGSILHTPLKTNNQILKEYQSWDDVNTTLVNSLNNGKPPGGIEVKSVNGCVQGLYKTVETVDKFGKAIMQGTPCVTCGKHVNYMPCNGYCSVECALKDMLKRIMAHKSKDKPYQKYIDAVQDTLNFLDLIMNVIMELPLKLKDITLLPPEYANFLTIRINIAFLEIRIMINNLMIFKNELIIEMLRPAKMGVIEDYIASIFGTINQIITLVQQLQMALDATFTAVLLMLNLPMLSLPAGCFAWIMTPRSIINLPQYPLYVPIQATPAVPSPPTPDMFTPLAALNVLGIASTLLAAFPPIIPLEYFMEPELFDVRLALSDQGDIVKQVALSLEMVMKLNAEYMPRYKNLSLTNPWFVIATIIGWAPKARMSFGSIINPMV